MFTYESVRPKGFQNVLIRIQKIINNPISDRIFDRRSPPQNLPCRRKLSSFLCVRAPTWFSQNKNLLWELH